MFFRDCLGLNYSQIYKELRRSPSPPPPLPSDFIFGVATADHQCEAYEEGCRDIRDIWEPEVGRVHRGQATDFWKRYSEDIENAQKLKCKAFRFSIAWSRVQPYRREDFNEKALQHYRDLVDCIIKAGMEPIVTLHHFAWPTWVYMIDPKDGKKAITQTSPEDENTDKDIVYTSDFPDVFGNYAKKVAACIGRDVRYWVTINEPNHLIWGYFKPWWEAEFEQPPGHLFTDEDLSIGEQLENVGRLIRNMYCAHSRAYDEIKKVNPHAMVGSNPYTLGLPYWLQCLFNSNAARAVKGIESFQELVLHNPEKRFLEGHPRDRGEVDAVIATLTKTSHRERNVNFSEVYFIASQQLMVKAASQAKSAQDLAEKMVAVVAGSTAQINPPALLQKSQLLTVHDYKMALEMLNKGHAEAILADNTILHGLMKSHPGQYRMIEEKLTSEPYAVAVTPGHLELLAEINRAIRDFKTSGEWEASCKKHLGLPIPAMPASLARTTLRRSEEGKPSSKPEATAEGLKLKSAPLKRIIERGYLKVAVKSDVSGFGYCDPDTGEYSGLEIDLARAIARQILGDGNRIRLYSTSTEKRMSKLHSSLWEFLDSVAKIRSILSTAMAYSSWWYLGMAGRLPEPLCPKEVCCQPERDYIPKELWHKPKQDYIGLDYYYGIWTLRFDRIMALLDSGKKGDFDNAPVWPGALYSQIDYLSKLFPDQPGLPVFILENGCVDNVDMLKYPIDRRTYICRHVQQVQRAIANGINVKMYIYWSLTTNHEWGFPHEKKTDFGLYRVNLDSENLDRKAKDADVELYRRIIENHGVGHLEQDCSQLK